MIYRGVCVGGWAEGQEMTCEEPALSVEYPVWGSRSVDASGSPVPEHYTGTEHYRYERLISHGKETGFWVKASIEPDVWVYYLSRRFLELAARHI